MAGAVLSMFAALPPVLDASGALAGALVGALGGAPGGAVAEPAWFLRLAGRLHPLAVHFPIALLLVAAFLEIVMPRRERRPRPTVVVCVVIGAVGAGVAAWFGWISAAIEPPPSSAEQTLLLHRWAGVATAGLAGIAALLALLGRASGWRWSVHAYRALLVLSAVGVTTGGYFGGELVHGRGYLLDALRPVEVAPLPPQLIEAAPAAADAPGAVSLVRGVQAIFDARCVECHGPARRKGGVRLDALEHVFAGDPALWVVAPGNLEGSPLYERITLPVAHRDRMPAEGPPLEIGQIATIRAWIEEGAPRERAPDTAGAPAPVGATKAPATAETSSAPSRRVVTEPPDPEAAAARAAAIAALRQRGAAVTTVGREGGLDVSFGSLGADVEDADLALLDGVAGAIRWLNLSRTAITDAGLARLGGATALERLRLDRTAIGDDGVAHLAALPVLSYLNLHGTRVTDGSVDVLASFPALRRLYLWQTAVTEDGAAALRAARPDLDVVLGTTAGLPVEEDPDDGDAGDDAALPACCAAAVARGSECDHACCVEAREGGVICAKCAGTE